MKGIGIVLYCGLKATAGSQNAETLTGEVEHCLEWGQQTRETAQDHPALAGYHIAAHASSSMLS